MTQFPGVFTHAQHEQLLQPIHPARILKDGKGMSHVSQQDIVAHLSRIFGFGNWGTEVLDLSLIFEHPRDDKQFKYDVCYRATVRLTIYDSEHNLVTIFEDASTGDAQNQRRADGHDLAMKSAISLAIKRCAKNLGDQFGLSLYNKGQQTALVKGTLVEPDPEDAPVGPPPDVQEGVDQQVSLGIDEVERAPEATDEQEAMLAASLGAQRVTEEPASQPASTEAAPESVEMITDAQSRKMGVLMKTLEIVERDHALATVTEIVGRPIASRNELTKAEAGRVLDALDAQIKDKADRA